MFMDRLFNQSNAPLLGRMLEFTSRRQTLLAENVANMSTPGYQQRDLSMPAFQEALRQRADARREAGGAAAPFDDVGAEPEDLERGMLFHDGQTRSPEQLVSDYAKNGMLHNLVVELLRKQFQQLEMALKDKPT